jgi:hypothetical protein
MRAAGKKFQGKKVGHINCFHHLFFISNSTACRALLQEKESQLFKTTDATMGLSPKEMEDNPPRLRSSENQGTEAVFQHCL